jgi:DNA-binding SARP family transcriptional activator
MVGKTLAGEAPGLAPVRIYLAGGIAVLGADGSTIGESAFAGRQGRRLFVRLAAIHGPVAVADLADDLWGPDWPAAWEVAIRSLASKLRATLARAGLPAALSSRAGTYWLAVPGDTWVDLDAASDAIHRAEAALAHGGSTSEMCGWALAARAIASRPLLPGEEGEWLDDLRRRLVDVRLRSLETLAEVWLLSGDAALAARDATEAIELDPYRETAHRLLIRAHLAAGDNAAAAVALEACRVTFRDELDTVPSPETMSLVPRAATSQTRG